jgi:hypothetical protein
MLLASPQPPTAIFAESDVLAFGSESLCYIALTFDKVSSWYKALVVAGAVEHGLPTPHIEWLQTTVSLPIQT